MNLPAPPAKPRWRTPRLMPAAGPVTTALLMLIGAAVLYAAYLWLDPTPDKRIVMATGPDQGAYAEFAKRYVPLLRANGVTLVLRPTQGSQENVSLLRDPASGVQIAFVLGGVEQPQATATAAAAGAASPASGAAQASLMSLGSVAYEPLWLFYREDSVSKRVAGPSAGASASLAVGSLSRPKGGPSSDPKRGPPNGPSSGPTSGHTSQAGQAPTRLAQLNGWRINAGPVGGGSGPLLRRIAADGGLALEAVHDGQAEAVHSVVDLVQGRDDALALVSAADAPFVQYLLRTPGVRLFNFVQAEAFERRFPFLHALRVPRGLLDPAHDEPPADAHLVAATASLVARTDLHPALVQLLVQAARQVHGEPGWFSRHGQFPNLDAPNFPPSPEAERFYRQGAPWLQRLMPFWLANFFDRMWIVLLPLLAVLVPLARVLPPMVELRLRSRVYRWYRQLRALDEARGSRSNAELLQELDGIEARVADVQVPLRYADELYALRAHIDMVRRSLGPGGGEVPPADEA